MSKRARIATAYWRPRRLPRYPIRRVVKSKYEGLGTYTLTLSCGHIVPGDVSRTTGDTPVKAMCNQCPAKATT